MDLTWIFTLFVAEFSITTAASDKCYDCRSDNHPSCGEEFSSSSGFFKDCGTGQLDREQRRCVKTKTKKDDIVRVLRSCVKEDTPAASMPDGTCKFENDVITCVCSGYLCNSSSRLQIFTTAMVFACIVSSIFVVKEVFST